MPLSDWQFWLVTLLALWGGWVLLRPLLPRKKKSADDAACPGCSSGQSSRKPKSRRVAITIERQKV